MKRTFLYIAFALVACANFSCKTEQKAAYYSDIYSEKPTTIYLAPTYDYSERKVEKYPSDIAYNNEVNTAHNYFYQTMAGPLLNHGYYVIGPVASEQIAASEERTAKQLKYGDLSNYNTQYGIDAIMLTTIHRWKEENGKWTVYLEYILRSTKSGVDLLHKWVVATKEVPTDLKKDPIVMKSDKIFAKRLEVDNGTAQRCFLVEKVNDYILRNIPISATRRQYENDLYKSATATYIRYTWSADGNADVQSCTLEEYEQGAFL